MNRNGVFAIVLVAGLLGTGWYVSSKHATAAAQKSAEALDLQSIREGFLEQAGWIRAIPDADIYRADVNPFLGAYFEKIAAHRKQFAQGDDFDSYLETLGKVSHPELHEKFFELVKTRFDQLRSGHYHPLWSATDDGMRLDVISADVHGDKVRLNLLLWGAPRQMTVETSSGGTTHIERVRTSAEFDVTWKLFNARGKLYGKMTASGDPAMRVDYPEHFIRDFPPQILLGQYDMDLIPSKVKKMEIDFQVSSTTPTHAVIQAHFVWSLDSIPADWQGGAWTDAKEITADH